MIDLARDVAPLLPPDPIIIEAGCHIGSDTLAMAKQWPKGSIHAFEPVDELRGLAEGACGLPNVRFQNMAIGAKLGRATLHLSNGGAAASSSLLQPTGHLETHPEITFAETREVSEVTLDWYMGHARLPRVDFLWMDIQGGEPAALKASPRAMASARAIFTEVSLVEQYEGTMIYPDFREWMASQGFIVSHEWLPWPDMGNVLFVRP